MGEGEALALWEAGPLCPCGVYSPGSLAPFPWSSLQQWMPWHQP